MHRSMRLAGLGLAMFALVGCGRSVERGPGDVSDLQEWTANVRSRPAPALPPLPVMREFENYEYASHDLRDPFSDAFRTDGGSGLSPDADRRKQPLEEFPLDSLKMVGSMSRPGGALFGLVMTTQNVTHRVSVGDYMGQSDGRVVSLSADRIELVELVPDGAGGWLERPAALALE